MQQSSDSIRISLIMPDVALKTSFIDKLVASNGVSIQTGFRRKGERWSST